MCGNTVSVAFSSSRSTGIAPIRVTVGELMQTHWEAALVEIGQEVGLGGVHRPHQALGNVPVGQVFAEQAGHRGLCPVAIILTLSRESNTSLVTK